MSRFHNFGPDAADDLDAAAGWILDQGGSAATVEKLLAAVLAAAERLAERPLLGRRQPDLLPEPFRLWSIPRHHLLLVYDPTVTPAMVVRIVSTDQDLPAVLADLRDLPDPEESS